MTHADRRAGSQAGRDADAPMHSATLLQRVAAGDYGAMNEAIDEYGGLIWSLARRYCPNPAEAEDGVQSVFVSLWENAERFDPSKAEEVTFVAMIARRRLIDGGRAYERRRNTLEKARALEESRPVEHDTSVADSDEAQKAMKALQQLAAPQRRVLELAIHQGYTHQQIAEITELPLGTVKTHARRGLHRIRELMGALPGQDEGASSGGQKS